MNSNANGRTVVDIVRDLLAETTALLRKESQLARAEISEKVDQAVRGAGLVVAGAVLLIPALVVLLGAAVFAMIDAVPAMWSGPRRPPVAAIAPIRPPTGRPPK